MMDKEIKDAIIFSIKTVTLAVFIFLLGHEITHVEHAWVNGGNPTSLSLRIGGETNYAYFNETSNKTESLKWDKGFFFGGEVYSENPEKFMMPANIFGFNLGEELSASIVGFLFALSYVLVSCYFYAKKAVSIIYPT